MIAHLAAAAVVIVLLLAGHALRAPVRILRRWHIPASMVGGFIGLIVAQVALLALQEPSAAVSSVAALRQWPTWLIAIIFAGLLLDRPEKVGGGAMGVASQGIAAWVIILGQLAIGLGVTAVLLSPLFETPQDFGQLLEVSWAGGFGSASAWGGVHEKLARFPQARDLAVIFAASGLLWGVLSGVVLVNIAVRRGWCRPSNEAEERTTTTTIERASSWRLPAATATLLAITTAFGWAMSFLVVTLAQRGTARSMINQLQHLPLFLFTLLAGWILGFVLRAARLQRLLDSGSLSRITSLAMDLLIVAALASLRIEELHRFGPAALILLASGAAWCALNLVWISRLLLPREFWFELGLLNYGFATATTAQGLMLLRMIDPTLRGDAPRVYALAAPLTAPFVGGGIITISLPYMLAHLPAGWIALAAGVLTVVLCAAGAILRSRDALRR